MLYSSPVVGWTWKAVFYLAHQLDLTTGITESFSHSRPVLAIAGLMGLSREAQLGDK